MEINDLLNLYIKKVDSGAPPVSALIIELLEAWAALKDHEVNNQLLEELESSGPPIGTRGLSFTDEKILFKAEQIQIYPGDKLMFYTDGLVEYYNNNHEYYGHSRFFDSLKEHAEKSVADIVDATINSLKLFGNNAKPADDVTLLGIELY